jgi:5-deoxy-glucuronate isomerase
MSRLHQSVFRQPRIVLVPYEYHPVSTAPGYRLYYLWGTAGEQRRLTLFEDPAHTWVHQAPQA